MADLVGGQGRLRIPYRWRCDKAGQVGISILELLNLVYACRYSISGACLLSSDLFHCLYKYSANHPASNNVFSDGMRE